MFSKADVAYAARPYKFCVSCSEATSDSLTPTQKTESLTGKLKPESVSGVSLRTSTPRHVRAGHQCCSPPSCLVRKLGRLRCNLSASSLSGLVHLSPHRSLKNCLWQLHVLVHSWVLFCCIFGSDRTSLLEIRSFFFLKWPGNQKWEGCIELVWRIRSVKTIPVPRIQSHRTLKKRSLPHWHMHFLVEPLWVDKTSCLKKGDSLSDEHLDKRAGCVKFVKWCNFNENTSIMLLSYYSVITHT